MFWYLKKLFGIIDEEFRIKATEIEKLTALKMYYLNHLVDDPIDGSRLDCDVLDALNALIGKYK